MTRVLNLTYFDYNKDILIINNSSCIFNRGTIIYKTEFDRLRAIEIVGRRREIQFRFDGSFIYYGNVFIDIDQDDYWNLNICFNANRIDFIKENPEYVNLAYKVSFILQKSINNSHYYMRLDISKDYSKYYDMIVNDYKHVSNKELNQYRLAIQYLNYASINYKYKDIISLKKSMDFNVLGFRPIEPNYHQHIMPENISDNINANLLKTTGEFDRFIQTVQYWKLQNA